MPSIKYKTLEEVFSTLLKRSQQVPGVDIKEIIEILSGKSQSLILIFLTLPFCLPIQIPGFSTVFGLIIALIGVQIACSKRLWLPKPLLFKTVPSIVLQKITDKSLYLLKKMKRFMRPRLDWLCRHPLTQVINGLAIVLLAILLALPLPIPLSNMAVAWPILFISLGMLKDDGVFILIGYLTSLFAFLFFGSIFLSLKYYLF